MLGLTTLVLSRLWQRHRRRRPYRAALVELAEWERAAPSRSAGDAGATLTALLRRVALLHYPRDRVAPLSGTASLRSLTKLSHTHLYRKPRRGSPR